jgi:hypothetical protein
MLLVLFVCFATLPFVPRPLQGRLVALYAVLFAAAFAHAIRPRVCRSKGNQAVWRRWRSRRGD